MNEENTKKDSNTDNKKTKKKIPLLAKILFGLAGAIVLLVIVVVCYILHLLSLPEIVPDNVTSTPKVTTTAPTTDSPVISTGDISEPTTSEEETTSDISHLEEITVPSTSEGETVTKETAPLRTEKGVYNIILLGIDPTEGLTDAMIVATINQNDNTIKLTSFMRDLFVADVPGFKPNRLNTVYTNGGMPLLKQVFKETFGIELHGFVSVDYNILVDVVDALGGIELFVSEAEADFLNTSNYIADEAHRTLIPGATQQMDGYQVVGYCRLRYVRHGNETDDFARTRRQREVLIAIYNKFRHSDLTTLLGLFEKVLPLVKTDLDKLEMISMATKALAGVKNDIEQLRIPVKGSYGEMKYRPTDSSKYMSVIGWEADENIEAIHEFMFGDE